MKLLKLKGRGCEYLFRHPVYKTIYFRRFTLKTGEITKSLETKDVEKAKEKRDQLIGGAESPKQARQRKTAWELYERFGQRKAETGKSKATMVSIRTSGRYFEPYFRFMMPDEIKTEWWERVFIPETKFKGFKFKNKKSVEIKRAKVRRFFNNYKWLTAFLQQMHEDGVIHKLPKIKNPDEKRTVGRVLSDDEVGDLLNFAQNPDLHLAILMGATMGMRRGEIFGLRTENVNVRKKTITLKAEETKTRKGRTFAISPDTLPELIKRAKSGSEWVFPSKTDKSKPLHKDGFKTAWKNLRRTTGIKCRFHDLRHTFLTKAFASPGANPSLICHYAGLSLEVAERVYLHLSEDDSKSIAGLVSYDL